MLILLAIHKNIAYKSSKIAKEICWKIYEKEGYSNGCGDSITALQER